MNEEMPQNSTEENREIKQVVGNAMPESQNSAPASVQDLEHNQVQKPTPNPDNATGGYRYLNEKDNLDAAGNHKNAPHFTPVGMEEGPEKAAKKKRNKWIIIGIVLLIVIGIPLLLFGTCFLLISTSGF